MKNLAFYKDEDRKLIGVLIDYDLATMPPFEKTDNGERIGTVAFMACEFLNLPNIKYGLHHDYESFLYCAIWHGLGYETCERYPRIKGTDMDILYDWRVGQYDMMACYKAALSPKHIAFGLMQDRKFAGTCLRLWEVFNRALIKRREEYNRQAFTRRCFDVLVFSGDVPGSKATYPMLMRALGHEVSACGGECCI